jgi:glycosyltransferase involved in cell wall biosynthesis
MKKKIKVLRLIPTLDPKWGGPVHALINSSIVLIRQGFEVDILTCDPKNSNFHKINKFKIINKGPGLFGNFLFSPRLFFWLLKNKEKYDFFLVHAIWDFKNIVMRIFFKKKYSVFIHGSLHPSEKKRGFLRTLKKQIYWWLIEKKNLLCSSSILLTSNFEVKQLNKTFVNTDKIKKTVIKYGIIKKKINKTLALKKFYIKFPYLKKKDFYLYIGRIHPQKACEVIIKSVNQIKKKFKKKILIMGPLSGSKYELYLMSLVKKYNLENQISFSNAEYGDIKWGALLASKAMVSATHGENFGISFVESLSLGKPVLTTFKVNIFKEILKFNAGLISKDNTNDYSKILLKFDQFNKIKMKKISKNATLCFKENFDLSSKKNSLASYIKNEIKKNISYKE